MNHSIMTYEKPAMSALSAAHEQQRGAQQQRPKQASAWRPPTPGERPDLLVPGERYHQENEGSKTRLADLQAGDVVRMTTTDRGSWIEGTVTGVIRDGVMDAVFPNGYGSACIRDNCKAVHWEYVGSTIKRPALLGHEPFEQVTAKDTPQAIHDRLIAEAKDRLRARVQRSMREWPYGKQLDFEVRGSSVVAFWGD